MGRFDDINPLDMNIPLKLSKTLLILLTESLAGRVGKEKGSFDWKNEKGWELPIKEWEPLVPTHGNFAGPGYSCGKRQECDSKEIRNCAVSSIRDPLTGKERNDFVDILAKNHDDAYSIAKGKPDYWEQTRKADRELVTETRKLLDGTSLLIGKDQRMSDGETSYAETMLDGFKLKLVMMDEPFAAIEKFKNSGYGKQSINNFMNTLSQGISFHGPREFLRKLNLSENELTEIEKKYAEYCEQNNIQLASASSGYSDTYTDDDQDYYYGPGMDMG